MDQTSHRFQQGASTNCRRKPVKSWRGQPETAQQTRELQKKKQNPTQTKKTTQNTCKTTQKIRRGTPRAERGNPDRAGRSKSKSPEEHATTELREASGWASRHSPGGAEPGRMRARDTYSIHNTFDICVYKDIDIELYMSIHYMFTYTFSLYIYIYPYGFLNIVCTTSTLPPSQHSVS